MDLIDRRLTNLRGSGETACAASPRRCRSSSAAEGLEMSAFKNILVVDDSPIERRLAVGLLNHAYNIQRSIEQGLRVFDFMRGDESYKYHLGGQDRRLFRVTAQRG